MKRLTTFILLILSFNGNAQHEKVIHDQDQFWWSINTTTRITDNFGAVADFHIRRTDFLSESNFYFARVGAAWWVNDQFTIVAGYAHLWLSRDLEEDHAFFQDENRIYQQFAWRQSAGGSSFLLRLRNEQRWHEVTNEYGNRERTRFSNRVRFLASCDIRIFSNPSLPKLVVSDEVLVHFGKEIVYNTFDQNRLFGGLKVPLTRDLKFDIGYMLVYQQLFNGYEYDLNHTFRWFFYYTPDLRRGKE